MISAVALASKSLSANKHDAPSPQSVKFIDPSFECNVYCVPHLCLAIAFPREDFVPLILGGIQLTYGTSQKNFSGVGGGRIILVNIHSNMSWEGWKILYLWQKYFRKFSWCEKSFESYQFLKKLLWLIKVVKKNVRECIRMEYRSWGKMFEKIYLFGSHFDWISWWSFRYPLI